MAKVENVAPSQNRKWEVEDAARMLMKAEEIKSNKPLFKEAKKELLKQQKAITKVTKNVIGIA